MSDQAPVTREQPTGAGAEQPSVGELVAAVQRDMSLLVKQEIALAKSELKINVKVGGISIALFAGAAFLLLLAVIMASVGLAYLVNLTGLDLVWCFFVVFGLYVLLAALMGFIGARKIRKVRGPERAIHQAHETKDTLLRRS